MDDKKVRLLPIFETSAKIVYNIDSKVLGDVMKRLIHDYFITDEEKTEAAFDPLTESLFDLLYRDACNYERYCKRQSENRKKRKATTTQPTDNQSATTTQPNGDQNTTTTQPTDNQNEVNNNININNNNNNNINNNINDNINNNSNIYKQGSKQANRSSYNDMIDSYTQDENLRDALKSFVQMRCKMKKAPTDRALELIFSKLNKLSGFDDEKKTAIVNQSVMNGYQGVFDLKEDTTYSKPQEVKTKYQQDMQMMDKWKQNLQAQDDEYISAEALPF